MHDIVHLGVLFMHSAWRWRWLAMLIAWVFCLVGWFYVERIPDTYQSQARVHIDTESMLHPLMRGMTASTGSSIDARLAGVRRTLLTRPNLEEVMRMTDLDIAAPSVVEQDRIIASLRARLRVGVRRGGNSNTFHVSFSDQDPQLAQNVVQALLTLFVESNLGASREQIAQTQAFLDNQIIALEQQLEESQQKLARFRMERRGFLPGSANFSSRLGRATNKLEALQSRRVEEVRVRDELARELARMPATAFVELSPEAKLVAQLEQQVDDLLSRYTEQHPDVILTRRQLERQREVLKASLEAAASAEENGSDSESQPPNSPFHVQLKQYDTRIASLDRDIAKLEAQVEDLVPYVEQIPEVQSEYSRLQREYHLIRRSHGALVQRREKARFTDELETKSERVKFKVVEPPSLPSDPSGPDRLRLRTGVLLGGLAVGAGFAALLGFAFPTFHTSEQIKKAVGLTVLGVVSKSRTSMDRVKFIFDRLGFGAALAGLVAIFFLVLSGFEQDIQALLPKHWDI